jgi:hypothetical protein
MVIHRIVGIYGKTSNISSEESFQLTNAAEKESTTMKEYDYW